MISRSLTGFHLLALLLGAPLLFSACAADDALTGAADHEAIGEDHEALTAEQCAYFDVNGKVQICHHTNSKKKPYTIIRPSVAGCIAGHAGHAEDYITSTDPSDPTYDPSCSGGGCLPQDAPCDATLPCCGESTCSAGTCVCDPGWTGERCEVDIDECESSPCLYGTCTDEVNGYTCDCQDGYTGDNCEVDIDECESSPCLYGTCTDEVNGYTCDCQDGYTGDDCEIDIDECESSPCLYGTCTDEVNGYTCDCQDGYTGDNCEIDVDECASGPCLNGGMCTEGVNSFSCDCGPDYEGDVCQNIAGCLSGLPAPAGFWKGEDAQDNSGNGHDVTLRGATFDVGQVGQAFDTQLGDVAISTADPAFASLDAITIDMWINIRDAAGVQVLFSRNRSAGGTGYSVYLFNGQLGLAVNNGAGVNQVFQAPVALALDTWIHITVSRSANVVDLYVDCVPIAQTTTFFAGTINLASALPVTIGSEDTVPGRRFRGLIDEVSFYPAKLSDADVTDICAAASAGVCVP